MKIEIFENKDKSKNNSSKKSRKSRKRASNDNRGRLMLDMLHPMSFSFFVIKSEENYSANPNNWFSNTLHVITEKPWSLTEKWVLKINSITEDWIKSAMLDEPSVPEGSRESFGPMLVHKVLPPKANDQYPTPALIAIDSRGWKWYFKTTKAFSFKENDVITFVATVSSHKEGISFLKRPAKIVLSDTEI